MAVDYADIASKTLAAIEGTGRLVTLVSAGETPSDPAAPWDTSAASGGSSTSVTAVMLEYALRDVDGETVRRGDQQALIAAAGVPSGVDMRAVDTLIDDTGEQWRVISVETLRPGASAILHTLHLRRA